MKKELQIGLIGFGNIGTGVVNTLNRNSKRINSYLKRPLRLVRIADIDIVTKRAADYDSAILTAGAYTIIDDPEIDVVIELIGGVEPAKEFIEASLRAGKHVVTANKAMLAEHGAELWQLAEQNKVYSNGDAEIYIPEKPRPPWQEIIPRD